MPVDSAEPPTDAAATVEPNISSNNSILQEPAAAPGDSARLSRRPGLFYTKSIAKFSDLWNQRNSLKKDQNALNLHDKPSAELCADTRQPHEPISRKPSRTRNLRSKLSSYFNRDEPSRLVTTALDLAVHTPIPTPSSAGPEGASLSQECSSTVTESTVIENKRRGLRSSKSVIGLVSNDMTDDGISDMYADYNPGNA